MPHTNKRRRALEYQDSTGYINPRQNDPVKNGGNASDPVKCTSLKNQIRSVQRLLRRQDLTQDRKAALSDRLQALDSFKKARVLKSRERHFALKYHKVKFFERRKAERKLAKLRKLIKMDPNPSEELLLELKTAEENLLYVIYFPNSEKYISLYGKQSADGTAYTEETRKRQLHCRKQALRMAAEAADNGDVLPTDVAASVKLGGAAAVLQLRRIPQRPLEAADDDSNNSNDDDDIDSPPDNEYEVDGSGNENEEKPDASNEAACIEEEEEHDSSSSHLEGESSSSHKGGQKENSIGRYNEPDFVSESQRSSSKMNKKEGLKEVDAVPRKTTSSTTTEQYRHEENQKKLLPPLFKPDNFFVEEDEDSSGCDVVDEEGVENVGKNPKQGAKKSKQNATENYRGSIDRYQRRRVSHKKGHSSGRGGGGAMKRGRRTGRGGGKREFRYYK